MLSLNSSADLAEATTLSDWIFHANGHRMPPTVIIVRKIWWVVALLSAGADYAPY